MEQYYNQTITEVSQKLEVDPLRGLTAAEVSNRAEKYGPNKLES